MSPVFISIVIVLYFGLLLTISHFTSKGANNESFFVGNRSSKWYVVAFGMLGASLSGVTFISVPGMVRGNEFMYMQIVYGYIPGYLTVAFVLLPVYYKLKLTSIYTYLDNRFGVKSYKTGSAFFLISRTIGASFRLFLVANVLQITVFDAWNVPFVITVLISLALIWLYTYKAGIKTIIWTDTLQTTFLLLAIVITIFSICKQMNMGLGEMISQISLSEHSKMFEFSDLKSDNNFWKQFFSGAFITIVMTGLDQDMMQKNLSCRTLKDAQKNMVIYGIAFVPINLLFMALGAMLLMYANRNGIALPARADDIYPMIATQYLGNMVSIFFIIGLLAAAYSSADSALTSLTTSFTVDILNAQNQSEEKLKRTRTRVHLMFSVLLAIIIIIFRAVNDESVIASLFKVAGYTYGPLLGMFAFGLFTRIKVRDRLVPIVAIASPIVCLIIDKICAAQFGYKFGYELLIFNGMITFVGMWLLRLPKTEVAKE